MNKNTHILYFALILNLILVSNCMAQEGFPVEESGYIAEFNVEGQEPTNNVFADPRNLVLYTISFNGVKIPISLNYSSTGRKFNDEASIVGLNWDLSVGDKIFRKVNGVPDEASPALIANYPFHYIVEQECPGCISGGWLVRSDLPFSNSQLFGVHTEATTPSARAYTSLVYYNLFDMMPDEFSLTLDGTPADFLFSRDGMVHPLIDNGLQFTQNLVNIYAEPFIVTDKQGYKYHFTRGDYIKPIIETTESSTIAFENPNYHSSFPIKQIVSPEGETVDFTYETANITVQDYSEIAQFYNDVAPGYSDGFQKFVKRSETLIESQVVSTIITPNENITFTYDELEDPRSWRWETVKRLNSISITNTRNEVVKTFEFVYSTFGNGQIRLDKINLTSNGEQKICLRKFEYFDLVDSYFELKQDVFGYYNNNAGSYLFPNGSTHFSSNNRSPNQSLMQVGQLSDVYTDNGGRINIQYDINGEGVLYAGGLVVKRLEYGNDNENPEYIKNFNYSNLEGYVEDLIDLAAYRKYSDASKYPGIMSPYEIHYSRRYKNLTNRSNSTPPAFDFYHSSGAYFNTVEELKFDPGSLTNIGKTIYRYAPAITRHIKTYVPLKEEIYDRDGNIVKELIYERSFPVEEPSSVEGLYTVENYTKVIGGGAGVEGYYDGMLRYFYHNINRRLLIVTEKDYFDGNVVSQVTEYTRNNKGQITSVMKTDSEGRTYITEYTYVVDFNSIPSNHVFQLMINKNIIEKPIIISKWMIDGNDEKLVESSLFCYNEFGKIIEKYEAEFIGEYYKSQYTMPHFSGSNFVFDDNLYKSRKSFIFNNNGDIIGERSNKQPPVAYIRGYNSRLVVAEVIGGETTQGSLGGTASYIGFESNNATNSDPDNDYWNCDGKTFVSGGHTGEFSMEIPGNGNRISCNRFFQPSTAGMNGTYVFSAWVNTSNACDGVLELAVLHANGSNLSGSGDWYKSSTAFGNTFGKWKYVELTINLQHVRNNTDASQNELLKINVHARTPSGQTFLIDDVRFHQLGSQMQTYTYKPIVGKTSESDANGIPVLYTTMT